MARKIAVAALGFAVLGVGVALIVLPGPAILVIPLALTILATEFVWAQTLLGNARSLVERLKLSLRQLRARWGRTADSRSPD